MTEAYFGLRGVVEGFYGTFYTFPERQDLIRFLGDQGFNLYLYGPKNDRQHRMRWWDPYPPFVLDRFEDTIALASERGIDFCYAISFGVPINYESSEEFATVTEKLRGFFDRGCRSFGILFDDLTVGFAHEENCRVFPNVASAHADVANRVLDWARRLDPDCTLFVCPAEYHGRPPFSPYVGELGRTLDEAVHVFYTGPEIRSRAIRAQDVTAFAEVLGRPPVIWDNYPVNDLQMKSHVHLGPLRGRAAALHAVSRGFASNLMLQAEASKIALHTVAEYLHDPLSYDPDAAWRRALATVAGAESAEPLRQFAESSLQSCLEAEEAPEMTWRTMAALQALRRDESVSSEPVQELAKYYTGLDEACYHLKHRMRNLALRQNLLPWIEALEGKLWLGRYALMALQTVESGGDLETRMKGMESALADLEGEGKSVGGAATLQLAELARERAALFGHRGASLRREPKTAARGLLSAGDDPLARRLHQEMQQPDGASGVAEAS
ncbi:MAG TPA: protein O-GlcNAcase [Chloroflexota bacterium]|nr:protein O-GlcNAcase [Chloroflexota bacterium]